MNNTTLNKEPHIVSGWREWNRDNNRQRFYCTINIFNRCYAEYKDGSIYSNDIDTVFNYSEPLTGCTGWDWVKPPKMVWRKATKEDFPKYYNYECFGVINFENRDAKKYLGSWVGMSNTESWSDTSNIRFLVEHENGSIRNYNSLEILVPEENK